MSKKRVKKKPKTAVAIKSDTASIEASLKNHVKVKWQSVEVASLLALVTIIVYCPILWSDFAYYDDESYITTNDHVLQGLSWEGFKWAFSSVGYSDNWHPLTWLSHMLDVQLFGLNPAGHHFTNLFFHILATLLLFGFLRYITKKIWSAALVAALFALHPLHVESVAWVAERKDVLSATFFFAILWGYAYYARRPGFGRYAVVLILFSLGLLSKPMLVTVPFVLLFIDYWPLKRLTKNARTIGRLMAEKLPFFIMAAASSIITVIAQHGALGKLEKYYLSTRISNSIISYGVYIGQVFWPTNLAVLYPYTRPLPVKVAACALLLMAITTVVIWIGRKKKYLITGWLWYIVTLIPVIGIIQVGSQAHADRYTYLSYVGLFIIIAWTLKAFADKLTSGKKTLLNSFIIVIFVIMTIKTWEQIGYWKNGITLLSHTVDVTKDNEIAQYNLGTILLLSDQTDEAIIHFRKSLEINPNKIEALGNLAGAYYHKKQFSEAVPLMQRALALAKATNDERQLIDITSNLERLNQVMGLSQKP
jgi:tetratricopeptide (TPR) repeat protein